MISQLNNVVDILKDTHQDMINFTVNQYFLYTYQKKHAGTAYCLYTILEIFHHLCLITPVVCSIYQATSVQYWKYSLFRTPVPGIVYFGVNELYQPVCTQVEISGDTRAERDKLLYYM